MSENGLTEGEFADLVLTPLREMIGRPEIHEVYGVPAVTCGNGIHLQVPATEPVFHFVTPAGQHGVAELEVVKSWARRSIEGGDPLHEYTTDLYILLPGSGDMIRCLLNVVDGDGGPELEVEAQRATVLESGVLYTCKI